MMIRRWPTNLVAQVHPRRRPSSGCEAPTPTATVCPVTQQQEEHGLPPLAPPDASADEQGRAIETRMVARYGAPTIDDYRRAYAGFGAEWPGDDEVRRRHIVAPDTAA